MRREFSRAVKLAAWRRCGGSCEECGLWLYTGKFAYDHRNPDGLTGEPTLENCRVLCSGPGSCHATKTKADVASIAKAKRQQAGHIGAKTRKYQWPKRSFSNWKGQGSWNVKKH